MVPEGIKFALFYEWLSSILSDRELIEPKKKSLVGMEERGKTKQIT